jgi:hypothetical protein
MDDCNEFLHNLTPWNTYIGSDYFVALDVDVTPSKDTVDSYYPYIVSLLHSNKEFQKELGFCPSRL